MAAILLPLLALLPAAQAIPSVLVYTRTAGYRHDSIPTAIEALRNQSLPAGGNYSVSFTFSEDPTLFTASSLATFDCLMFVSNSDEILGLKQQEAFADYLAKSGNFMAVHSASAALFNAPAYGREVGAYFDYHPSLQQATFEVINTTTHPSTQMLPQRWTFEEEVYYHRSDPRANGATLLLSVDESSYTDDGTSTGYYGYGDPHPIAWYQERGNGSTNRATAGRSFYTSLGHTNATWRDPLFMGHIMEGLKWTLESGTTLAFAKNGSVGNATGRIDGTSAADPVKLVSGSSIGLSLLAGLGLALGVAV